MPRTVAPVARRPYSDSVGRSPGFAASGACMRRAPRPVPGDGALEPVPQRRRRLPAEEVARAACVEAAARLPVRHRAVPGDAACEARDVGDELGEVADRDLVAGAKVDRLAAVVALGGERQPVDAVVDVEEL